MREDAAVQLTSDISGSLNFIVIENVPFITKHGPQLQANHSCLAYSIFIWLGGYDTNSSMDWFALKTHLNIWQQNSPVIMRTNGPCSW